MRFLHLLLLVAGIFVAGNGKAQLYWNNNTTPANLTSANWGTLPGGPFTTAWTGGSNIVFTANSTVQCTAAPVVGNVTVTGGNVAWTGFGNYSTSAAIRTMDIAGGSTLTWTGQAVTVVAGTGFNKTGAGTWNLGTLQSNYPGGFTLGAGIVLFAGNTNAFGTGALTINGGVIGNNSGGLRTISNSAINIGGNFQLGTATGASNISFVGNINLGAATRTITIGSAAIDTLRGIISGGAGSGLTIASISTGRIVLGNSGNIYSGATTINSGLLYAGIANSLPATTALVFANTAGAQFLLNNFNTTVGSIAGGGVTGGNIVLGSGALSTGGANSNTSYGGVISGTGSFTKTGTGVQTLTGANTYSGTTSVNAGTVLVNGSTSSLSAVTVASGATLGGNGTVAGTVSNNGTLSPGSGPSSVDTINTGATTFGANSTYLCEVSNVAGTPGVGWDFINSSGAINVTASPITITLTNLVGSGFNVNNAYTWIIATGTSVVNFNALNFVIDRSTFPVGGIFTVEQSGNSLQIVFTPPSGNSITLDPPTQLSGASFCNGAINNTITLT
ncbi:MAG TPA: autotransporter-associated beta strand repeat-containing protein, partial [Ferruginibacter sp.]|nr:autotransporter-associated beta strand repeat-containing protein [Ferruginibacter sp.]